MIIKPHKDKNLSISVSLNSGNFIKLDACSGYRKWLDGAEKHKHV